MGFIKTQFFQEPIQENQICISKKTLSYLLCQKFEGKVKNERPLTIKRWRKTGAVARFRQESAKSGGF